MQSDPPTPLIIEDTTTTTMYDDMSDLSSTLSSPPSSPIVPPSFYPTPAPSQHLDVSPNADRDGAPTRKRRKVERKPRTTQHLDLTSEASQSFYDRQSAMDLLLKSLKKRRKIVVVAGAGISVSAGIPDFRSSHGLFQGLKQKHNLKTSGKGLFDASVYRDDLSTSSFHEMVRDLSRMASEAKPTLFHRLLARLAREGRLLRLYTQNIDGIDTTLPPLATQVPLNLKAPWPQTIQLHGGLENMMCQKCQHTSESQPHLFDGATPPACPKCAEADSVRTHHAGKRSHGVGKLRPRIVLYNEHNPDEDAIGAVVTSDLRARPDAIVVVGTSMKIPGVKRIVKEMCGVVRGRQNGTSVWINRDPVPVTKGFDDCWDLVVKGDSDEVAGIVKLNEWDDTSEASVEECTLSEVERVQARQGPIEVVIPPLPSKSKASCSPRTGVLTPPSSQDDEMNDRDRMLARPMSPIAEQAPVQNPASKGPSITDILGKGTKTKSTANRKRQVKDTVKPKSSSGKQSLLAGKVTKHNKIATKLRKHEETAGKSAPLKSVDVNPIVLFPNLSPPLSLKSSTASESLTMPAFGRLPSGMKDLLN